MEHVERHIAPGMTHWQHPDFFAFFPAMVSPPAILGELLGSAFNQPGFNWVASPAATELEVVVTNWLVRAFGFPPERFCWSGTGGAVLQPSTTEGMIVAMLGAKSKATQAHGDVQSASTKLVCYYSEQAHFCVVKAARILFIPHMRAVPTKRDPVTGNYPMDVDALVAMIAEDRSKGLLPFFVSGNCGATGTCARDDLVRIGAIARENGLWFNVDAAYAGTAAICPELRGLCKGMGAADTILVNGSKWFNAGGGTTMMFFGEKRYIVCSLNASGVYLENARTSSGMVVDFKDYQLGLGRPFRSLKMWATLQSFGLEGMRATLRRHVALAKLLAAKLVLSGCFEVPITPEFGLVCFRLKNASELQQKELLQRINASNRAFMVQAVAASKTLLRISLAYPQLHESDIDALVKLLVECATKQKSKV